MRAPLPVSVSPLPIFVVPLFTVSVLPVARFSVPALRSSVRAVFVIANGCSTSRMPLPVFVSGALNTGVTTPVPLARTVPVFVSVPLVMLNVGVVPPAPLVYCRSSSPALVNPFAIVRLVGLLLPAIVTVPVFVNVPLIAVDVLVGIVSVPRLVKPAPKVTLLSVIEP